ncbi:MAG: hypothetical protein KKC30_09550 [Proteobacteria bacterium]|nr:hypothetical protein [Pseudomonadota bacterium]MBU4383290.1 hypothetical protein [Pseudomonadota bacterium]MBU4605264.1 hypothetical protein [Pseudomonadota bacterium]MCG2764329.1 hypothetical protein [Desulfarculaceae bacterium]
MTLELLLHYIYYACMGATLAAGALAWFAPGNWWRGAGWLVLALALAQAVVSALILNRPPLAGTYEAAMMFTLWLSVLALIPCGSPEGQRRLAALCWWAGTAFMALFLVASNRFYPDWYMYKYIWSRLFFTLRMASLAVFLYASFAALASLGMRPETRTTLLRWSRNFLLLGTAVFLAGEFSGFTWRMQWMGDYWCWNANFLEATLFFLLVTAAAHLPPSWAARPRLRAAAQAVPGVLMICLFMTFMLLEP